GTYTFDIIAKEWMMNDVYLPIGGMHNVENTIAAITVCQILGLDAEEIKKALAKFAGVKRRFEYIIKTDNVVFIDDYAHHPEELETLIKSAKKLFAHKKCVVVFQPHLYSRTSDFAQGFANSLSLADEVILLDIYPAREQPREGVTSQMIVDRMSNNAVTILSKDGLLAYAKAAPIELFITAGAGDIDKLIQPLKAIIEAK
ncbi:MAG: UDP-N-acetylmuramate--L-alanine ligase, partial [Chitinophagaceae bacterium]|nr:UDP-N-acetylmuramate--L-alanine ligase [Chitinophagaceae bacterium]